MSQETIKAVFTISAKKFVERSIQYALNKRMNFACWKSPNSKIVYFLISTSDIIKDKVIIESSKPGFCISPFHNPELKETCFLCADILYRHTGDEIEALIPSSEFENFVEKELVSSLDYFYKELGTNTSTESTYKKGVEKAVNVISNDRARKIVLSRIKKTPKPQGLNLSKLFIDLGSNYTNAFVSLISTEEFGTWIGATPETLIQISDNETFKTMALAGTQRFNHQNLKEAVWTQKEIEEQALVSKYIIHCFKSIRLREFDDIGPKTVRAGNLIHLKTEFSVDLKEINHEGLGTTMLELLHPTSAVCGMPKAVALDFISKHEFHDRQLFSGFLGPINIEEQTSIYVNLRCAQITKDEIIYYAGAGLTEDSSPEKEWLETEAKCSTIEEIING